MVRGIEGILLFSENAARLAEFYEEKVGLTVSFEGELGDEGDEVYVFDFENGTGFAVLDHSKVRGLRRDPERIMFNLEVDDIEEEAARLDKLKVKKIQDVYHVENYGRIATYEDIDGNYFQLIEIDAEEDEGGEGLELEPESPEPPLFS